MWTQDLYHGRKGLQCLEERGLISTAKALQLYEVIERFSFFVTEHYLGLIEANNPHCPIRLQVIPSLDEIQITSGEMTDPIGDKQHEASPGLVHRYPDRALLFLTHQCPIMCRFCFRKVYLNEENPAQFTKRLSEASDYLTGHPEIREVILSGGDPLMLNDRRLEQIFQALEDVPGVRSIRFHTRMLAALPQRISPQLIELLERREGLTMVLHINHEREWTPQAHRGARMLLKAGVRLLSQTVLLKGINDNGQSLRELFQALSDSGCTPYYLHHPDKTVGTQHFRVSIDQGLAVMKELRGTTPGYAIPTYVLDLPGGHGKIPVDSHYLRRTRETGVWEWSSPFGTSGLYHDTAVIQETDPAKTAAGAHSA